MITSLCTGGSNASHHYSSTPQGLAFTRLVVDGLLTTNSEGGDSVVRCVVRSEFVARTRNPETTVPALLAAARVEFGRVGFAEAKTDTIVERAGITRGAPYHHFADKTALSTAVVEQVLDEIDSEMALAAGAEASPLAALRKGIAAYLQCCTRAEVRRIVLQDGPAVLGRERWIEIDERSAAWYTAEFGEPPTFTGELLVGTPHHYRLAVWLSMQLGLHCFAESMPREFTERRPGLDHVAFACASVTELLAWAERLDRLGVPHGEILTEPYGR